MNKQERIMVFEETMQLCMENSRLRQSIERSIQDQQIYWENQDMEETVIPERPTPKLLLSEKRTLEAAEPYAKQGKKVCCLNFASYVTPGGGVRRGAAAQEESLCRISTLYPALMDKDTAGAFYEDHRLKATMKKLRGDEDPVRWNSDDCIFTPSVTVLREDTHDCRLMPEEDWYETDIITCCAPDFRHFYGEINEQKLIHVLLKRICRILQVAAAHGDEVLVLGAFGCGVFRNPPSVMASAFQFALEEFGPCFETVEFALGHNSAGNENYRAFTRIRHIELM